MLLKYILGEDMADHHFFQIIFSMLHNLQVKRWKSSNLTVSYGAQTLFSLTIWY